VWNGTSEVQRDAKNKRAKLITNKAGQMRFREPGFVYMGDTVMIWNFQDYLQNPKWKEDALRKSSKRKARQADIEGKRRRSVGTGSRKRFRWVMERLYEKSLQFEHQED
jgi:hypothetical protein